MLCTKYIMLLFSPSCIDAWFSNLPSSSLLLRLWNIKDIVRFEVFIAVTMKNVIFWDIKPQFVLHRRHITSPL
jgi:hypothetical protein